MLHQHASIVNLTTSRSLKLLIFLLATFTCVQQIVLTQAVQSLQQNNVWNSVIGKSKNSINGHSSLSINISDQFTLDDDEEEVDEESDEDSMSEEEYRVDESTANYSKVNNYRLMRDKVDSNKLGDVGKKSSRTENYTRSNEFKEIKSNIVKFESSKNEIVDKKDKEYYDKRDDSSRFAGRTYFNQINGTTSQTVIQATISSIKKSSVSPTNQYDNSTTNQLDFNKPKKQEIRIKNTYIKPLSSYYSNRLKTRHVASGDQLRILRREGQPLRLSCLPAFHAPSRSTVNWFKNGDLIKVPEQNTPYFKWSLQLKYLKPEDSGVYECVVQSNSMGRTSVLYRLKVLPSFASNGGENSPASSNKDSILNMKVNNTSNRSKKSVLDSHHQNNLVNWPTKLAESQNTEIDQNNLNELGHTVLSLRNVSVLRFGEKATLRCVVDGFLAQSHFRWFCKLGSSQSIDSSKLNGIKLSLDNQSLDLSNQLYQRNIILNLDSNIYQSLVNDGRLDKHHLQQDVNQSSPHQTNHQHDYQTDRLEMPVDNIYIESYKIFLPNGAYSYASELTVQVDQNALGEYMCINFGSSVHYKSAFIELKANEENSFVSVKNEASDQSPYYVTSSKYENVSLNDNRISYGWFDEDNLSNVAIVRHSPSSANKLNYLQHDKLNAPISAAITSESNKSKDGNIFLIIVPVTIGIVIAIILFSLINYLKKIPDIPDLSDQVYLVQQIKLSKIEGNNKQDEQQQQNLIMNPLAEENLDIDTVLNSTIKLVKAPLNQSIPVTMNQVIISNQTNTIAQLNEIYHPVVKGPQFQNFSHLLIKPTSNSTYYSVQKEDSNQINNNRPLNRESKQIRHNHHNLSTFYLNNKAQLEYEHTAFGTQTWPINCCETCPCNQANPHRTPD